MRMIRLFIILRKQLFLILGEITKTNLKKRKFLRPLGSFVYLDMLKEPFFKIENDYYMIKGVQGKDYFRIAVHGKHEDELQRLEEFLYSLRLIACRT